MYVKDVMVQNQVGLHARPATFFIQKANEDAFELESHFSSLLEYPQYTRPVEWHGKEVPPVLLSGHHANIEKWRRERSLERTYRRRPDMLEKAELSRKDRAFLSSLENDE